jgi:hypothetical protein
MNFRLLFNEVFAVVRVAQCEMRREVDSEWWERSESCRENCCMLQGTTLALGTITNGSPASRYNIGIRHDN